MMQRGGLHFWKNPWPGQHGQGGCVGRLFEASSSRGWFLHGALPRQNKASDTTFQARPQQSRTAQRDIKETT